MSFIGLFGEDCFLENKIVSNDTRAFVDLYENRLKLELYRNPGRLEHL